MSMSQRPGDRRLLPTRPMPPHRPRVLVVEEHPPAAEMVADFLGDEGYAVTVALGLAEAADALAAARYDLVLADSLRKSTTGLLTDRWGPLERVHTLAGGTPVIVTTAYSPRFFADYRDRGFADLLPKPFRLDDLLAVVRRHLAPVR
jgi:CheY-like chemotaxis protein